MPSKTSPLFLLATAVVFPLFGLAESPTEDSGLLALYDFASADGPVVKDRSGVGEPADLRIANPKAVRRAVGSLEIKSATTVSSVKPPIRIIDAIRRSGEISVEAWVRPANTSQDGPARIVTISKNSSERNFTIGQEKDKIQVRLRTTKTSTNGIPAVETPPKTVGTQLVHIVYTRERSGRARLYLNGQEKANRNVAGDAANWDRGFRLALANELSNDRPWLGTYHLAAIYGRALPPDEVELHFESGAESRVPELLAKRRAAENAKLFREKIEPILAEHCLECHDSTTRKGKLDLSLKTAALAGGKHGKVIVPGKPAESPLWEAVESDEMPDDDRDPLSSEEKASLKKWIEGGAVFAVDAVDPLAHKRDNRAAKNWVRRLTVPEYIATVRAAVGVDIEKEARQFLPPDMRADGFSNTAYNLNVDLKHVEAYAKLAGIIVSRMDVKEFAARFSRNRSLTDKPMIPHIEAMGKWVLRGPLEKREVAIYRGISTTVSATGGGFDEAVSFIVEAMLQSPRFIYQIENQRGGGTEWPVGDFELASRVSYILWGAPPDKELFDAAGKGQLKDKNRLASQVDRMLNAPRAVGRSIQFIDEWLDLGRLSNLRPNKTRFPNWNAALAGDMREETRAFFKEIVWNQKRPLSDLLNAQVTFVSPALAKHYGIKTKGGGENLAKVDLDGVPSRGGLLTQGSVLTMGGDNASMVTRGLFVLQDILRSGVTDPPPGTDTTPVPSKPGLTQRGAALERINRSECGKCHAKFEPLAFGLEKFDGLGSFYETDQFGNQLREDGEIRFPGTLEPVSYKTSAELMDLLSKNERVQESLTWKVAQFALGRPLVSADEPVLREVHREAKAAGGTYASLIKAIILSDLVRKMRTEAGG